MASCCTASRVGRKGFWLCLDGLVHASDASLRLGPARRRRSPRGVRDRVMADVFLRACGGLLREGLRGGALSGVCTHGKLPASIGEEAVYVKESIFLVAVVSL